MRTLTTQQILEILNNGTLDLEGQFLWGSNYTYMVNVNLDGDELLAVYKPTRGERPLIDFPSASLAGREVAAFLVSEAMGLDLVPPTVFRNDGPAGPGSLQLFVEHDPEYHYFNFEHSDRIRLEPVVLFDVVVNNADRKGGHILFDPNDHMWLIDHGLCFHVQDKLRTVIWDFAGEPIPNGLSIAMDRLNDSLDSDALLIKELNAHLNQPEVSALINRSKKLVESGIFPLPDPNRRSFPYPPI